MSKNRQDLILQILNERKFVTVNELSTATFTSPSSIRRDLTHMENNGLVKRTHGGVTLIEQYYGVASFYGRKQKNVPEKKIIAKKASALLRNGQKILLDGSSTATFLLPYISKLDSAVLFTNNILTALDAIEMGIRTHCIGGNSINGSPVLSGPEAYKGIAGIYADILFFSSQSLDKNGVISDSTEEENYLTSLMLNSSQKRVFLCDSGKFNTHSLFTLTTIDDIDISVFDKPFHNLNCNSQIL